MILAILKFRNKQVHVLGTYSDAAARKAREKNHGGRGVIFTPAKIEHLINKGWKRV